MLNISSKKAFLIIFIFLFFVSLAFNGWLSYQLSIIIKAYSSQQPNVAVLSFTDMFIRDILMADGEIDFDTRLSLETAVRGLNDQAVFNQWEKFVKSGTKEEASDEAKSLLSLLIKKVRH